MADKFWQRHEKQHAAGRKSVVDADFDFRQELDLMLIDDHLREEIGEWLEASESSDDAHIMDQDVDVANLAFLDWVARKYRRSKS